MFNRNGVLLLVVFLIAFAAVGCGKKAVIKPSEESMKATRALDTLQEMERAYKARDMAAVLADVSPDFKGGYSEFETRMRKDSETFGRVDLDLDVERVEETGNEVHVAFHWYGKWYDKAGKVVEGRGNTMFIFVDTGKMRLTAIVGDPPFGVVR